MRKMMAKEQLDRIDFEILQQLQNDARLSNKELAARVHLAPSTCLERVRRLQRIGALTGFHATVDPEVLGIAMQAMVAVRLNQHANELVEQFIETVAAHPAVVALYYLAGATDFQVHVAVRSTDDLRRLVGEVISARPGVAHVETSLIFDHRRSAVLPRYLE
jgi:DNA-binding Lrp family transcriptional regulator